LEELQEGDRVIIWARAKVSTSLCRFRGSFELMCLQWPGWQCIVESVKFTVRYGF
jgi:hypothetical protein